MFLCICDSKCIRTLLQCFVGLQGVQLMYSGKRVTTVLFLQLCFCERSINSLR